MRTANDGKDRIGGIRLILVIRCPRYSGNENSEWWERPNRWNSVNPSNSLF